MTDPSDLSRPAPPADDAEPEHELGLDPSAFLPEGTELEPTTAATADSPAPDPWGADAPEPEVPAWARDDVGEVAPTAPGAGPAPTDASPRTSDPVVDLDALTALETDLAAVDGALAALDAGDPARSPLLVDLLDL